MADAGQMLAQLWGNNPVDAYAKGAQIAASLSSLNQSLAAQTFQNNLNAVKLAQDQSERQFTNQLQAAELNTHTQNAETERMFALQKLDPQSRALALQLEQAKINHYNRTAPGVDPIPGAPGLPQGGAPQDNFNPLSFGTTPTASANGGPGVLPALPNANPIAAGPPGLTGSTISPDGQTVPTGAQGAAAVANDPAIQAQMAELQKAGLDMAAQHQDQYGRSWNDTLAIDPSSDPSDNTPSAEEIQSAQGIQNLSSQLAGPSQAPQSAGNPADQGSLIQQSLNETRGNPLANPPGSAPIPTAKQTVAAVPAAASVPPSGVINNAATIKPTAGIVSRTNPDGSGDGTGYKISQDADGTLVKQEFHSVVSKTINPATGKLAREWKPDGEAKPIKLAQTSQNWVPPATKQDGDMTLKLQGTIDGPNGVKTATYKADKGDGQWTVTPLVVPGTDHVQAYGITKPDGTRTVEQAKGPQPVKALTTGDVKELDTLATANTTALGDKDKKSEAFAASNGGKTPQTGADWTQAYYLLKKKQDANLADRLSQFQQAGYIVPAKYAGLLQTAAPNVPSVAPAPGASKLPSALQQFLPSSK